MQAPNPNLLHPHYPQIHPPNPHPNINPNPYQANYAYSYPPGTVVYPEAASVVVPPAYYTDPNWALHYAPPNPYVTGGTIPQNGTEQLVPAIPNYTVWTNPTTQPHRKGTWKRAPKKTKIVQSAWCEVCKIECNTRDVLEQHKLGKKHVKSLEKLKLAAMPPPVVLDKPVIGPQENPTKTKSKKKAAASENLETKKRKILEGGAAVDAVRTCEICNVVCNSEIVYKYHLVGSKHATMMKKHAASRTAVLTIN